MLQRFSIYEREKNRKNSEIQKRRKRITIINENIENQPPSVIKQDLLNSLLLLGNYIYNLINLDLNFF